MRIRSIAAREHRVPLTQPYVIAGGATDAVEIAIVAIALEGGLTGLGAATPEPSVTGETFEACRAALAPGRTGALVGRDLDASAGELAGLVARCWSETPAAAAALDMALHDLRAKELGAPLVALLGRVHGAFPTSITIGILDADQTVASAERLAARGARALKLKIGLDLDGDLERIARVRESLGPEIALRVDGNCGYVARDVERLLDGCARAAVELVEQPCPPEADDELRALPASKRRRLVADESIHTPADALRLAGAGDGGPLYGGYVVKLMKCGGVTPALEIAAIARAAGIDLMWGCMDESVISISAALHAAAASPATRWLDLDGSFDLARDPARGGFLFQDGLLSTLPAPGLGAELLP